MLYILLGLVLAIILIIVFFVFSHGNDTINDIFAALAVVLSVVTCVAVFGYCALVWEWYAARYKADIINREYNTAYTVSEVFYAKDVIETIRYLERTRIELMYQKK